MTDAAPQSRRARWVEGLDWIRADSIWDPDFGGSAQIYTALLRNLLDYLPFDKPRLIDVIHTEARRRIEAKTMTYEQAVCYLEALRLTAEDAKREKAAIEKILKRGNLRVVK